MRKIDKPIRVAAVWGKYPRKGFVLETTCSDTCMCDVCKQGFWIKKCTVEARGE